MDIQAALARPCSDRTEKPPTPRPPKTIDALRQCHTMPTHGIPKVSSITRSTSVLLTSDLDIGLLDLSVDDGMNEGLDDTIRSVRFLTAASNIDALFGCHSNQSFETSREKLSTAPSQKDKKSLPQSRTDEQPQQSAPGKGAASPPCVAAGSAKALDMDSVEQIKRLEFFGTEPVTPPGTDEKGSEEGGRRFAPSPKSIMSLGRASTALKSRTKSSSGQPAVMTDGTTPVTSPVSSRRGEKTSRFQAAIRINSLMKGKSEPQQDSVNRRRSIRRQRTPRENVENEDPQLRRRASLKEGVKKFLSNFVD